MQNWNVLLGRVWRGLGRNERYRKPRSQILTCRWRTVGGLAWEAPSAPSAFPLSPSLHPLPCDVGVCAVASRWEPWYRALGTDASRGEQNSPSPGKEAGLSVEERRSPAGGRSQAAVQITRPLPPAQLLRAVFTAEGAERS